MSEGIFQIYSVFLLYHIFNITLLQNIKFNSFNAVNVPSEIGVTTKIIPTLYIYFSSKSVKIST